MSQPRLPSILVNLRCLRSLSIQLGQYPLKNLIAIRKLVKSLSPTIQELDFSFLESQEIFLSDSGPPPWLFDASPPEIDSYASLGPQSNLWDVASCFPNLKSLKLLGRIVFTSTDIRHLPSPLTRLDLSWNNGFIDCDALPKQLLEFGISGKFKQFSSEKSFDQLPPNLIKFECPRSFYMSAEELSSLPRTITSIAPSALNWSHEMANAIPPHLTSIRCNRIASMTDATLFSRFPRQLTALSFDNIGNLKLKKEIIQSLPRALKDLNIAEISWENLQQCDFPQLTRLSIFSRLIEALTEETIEILPSSLLCFLYNGPSRTRILNAIKYACPKLQVLQVVTKSCIEETQDPFTFSLPSHLNRLTLPRFDGRRQEIENLILQGWKPFPWHSLPPFLQILTLDTTLSRINVSQLIHLPTTLLKLEFGYLVNDWEPQRDEIHGDSEMSPLKPPTAYDERDIFRNLPKGLTALRVQHAIRIFDHLVFKELPQTLTAFRWKTPLPHDRKVLPYLPKGLIDCSIHLDILTNEDIAITPRNLGFFGITAVDTQAITLDALHLLPPETFSWSLNLRDDLKLSQRLDAIQENMARGLV